MIGVVVPRNSLVVPYGLLPMKGLVRWVSAKPVRLSERASRCSGEERHTAEDSKDSVLALRLDNAAQADSAYTLIGCGHRKNVLFTTAFQISPKATQHAFGPRQPEAKAAQPSTKLADAAENTAAQSQRDQAWPTVRSDPASAAGSAR